MADGLEPALERREQRLRSWRSGGRACPSRCLRRRASRRASTPELAGVARDQQGSDPAIAKFGLTASTRAATRSGVIAGGGVSETVPGRVLDPLAQGQMMPAPAAVARPSSSGSRISTSAPKPAR